MQYRREVTGCPPCWRDSACRAVVVVAAFLALPIPGWPSLASAQTLQGHVYDQSDERPLEQVVVRLLDRDGDAVIASLTDSLGFYHLRMPEPGEYYVSAERLGYEQTRSPLLAVVDPEGVFGVDLSVVPSPLGIPGFTVTAERFAEIDQRLRLLIGRTPSSLRMTPIMRPAIEEHLALRHNVEDLLRWSSIPSLEVRQTPEGPCFLLRSGGRVKVPESCVSVYLNGVSLVIEAVPALPLDMVETVVVVMPSETITYPRGAVLLYTAGWIR